MASITGWATLDPALAALVGMGAPARERRRAHDEAVPDAEFARIRGAISRHAEYAIQAHGLRTRHAGQTTFVDFHLVVPGEMTVSVAHDICYLLERALEEVADHALITIHVEPENQTKHSGVVL